MRSTFLGLALLGFSGLASAATGSTPAALRGTWRMPTSVVAASGSDVRVRKFVKIGDGTIRYGVDATSPSGKSLRVSVSAPLEVDASSRTLVPGAQRRKEKSFGQGLRPEGEAELSARAFG